jgi:hypothetical protein
MALRLFIHLIYHVKLFCQTGLGNSFSFTEKADREAEMQKISSSVKLSCAKRGLKCDVFYIKGS